MDLKTFSVVFWTVLLAELGDKTQIATINYASFKSNKLSVFLASSLALVITSFIGVYIGSFLAGFISVKDINLIAGSVFIIIGIFMIYQAV